VVFSIRPDWQADANIVLRHGAAQYCRRAKAAFCGGTSAQTQRAIESGGQDIQENYESSVSQVISQVAEPRSSAVNVVDIHRIICGE
jgi:hypothetical protein